MSKILVNQISNYGDNSPIEVKEGLNIPTGKPVQADGQSGTNGQVLTSTGTGVQWTTPFNGDYNNLYNTPTIPAAQVSADWTATTGVSRILNKPIVPPLPSVTIAAASGGGSLSYTSFDGTFTFTPPDLSSYLTSLGDAANVTNASISNWDTAYGWGDHAQAGYLTAYTETQTLDDVLTLGSTTSQDITTTGKIYYSNNFADLTALNAVDASTYHGMFAHVHGEGHGYFAHAGGWTQLLDTGSSLGELGDVNLSTAPTAGQVLTYDGAEWIPAASSGGGGGIALSDISVTTNPVGTAALSYNNVSGVFSYTPPDLSSYLTSLGDAANVTNASISNWDTAYGWGDHSTVGYLKPEPDGSTNLDAPLTITRASDTITTSNAFTSAHMLSEESLALRLAAGANEFTDMAHICGGFLSNGNFVQIVDTYGGSGNRNLLLEMNPTTGQRVNLKYLWTNDSNTLFNVSNNDGNMTCQTEAVFQDLRLDSNGNIVTTFRKYKFPAYESWIVSINPSTWTISNQYQLSQTGSGYSTIVGKDGYVYYKGASAAIYKIDMSTGTVLSKLASIANYYWFDVDSSGNIYALNGYYISKYTWTGTTYTVAWTKATTGGANRLWSAKLTDSAVIYSNNDRIVSISTTDGSINWSRNLSGTNLTIPELDAGSFTGYDDWKTDYTYTSTITLDAAEENVYVKLYVQDGWAPENYEDARACIILVLNASTGNCVDSLVLRKTVIGGYGEDYHMQHGMYWNNNKLIVPNISGVNPATGDYYSKVYYDSTYYYSTAFSYVENTHLDTSNMSSNAGAAGPLYNSEVIHTGSSVYTTITDDTNFTVTDNTNVTPVVTISPTDLTLTSGIGILIYDESDATKTEYLIDNEISYYLSPSDSNTITVTSPSDKNTRVVEENVFHEEITSKKVRTNEIVLGHEAIAEKTQVIKSVDGILRGYDTYSELFTEFANLRLGTKDNIVIGECRDNPWFPTSDYFYDNSGGVQIGHQTRLTYSYGVAIGYQSGPNTTYTDGGTNVFVGQQTGGRAANANVGSEIVNIGAYAGAKSTGSKCISIGARAAGHVNHTGNNQITIGNGVSQVDPTANTGLAIGCYTGNYWNYDLGDESYWLTGDSSFNVNIPQQLTAGSLVAGGLTYPTSNGTSGDVLTSDGAGNVTWAAAGGGGANVTISDTAPSSPSAGDLWWESDTGRLKIRYHDVDTQQWVDASPPLADATSIGGSGTVAMKASIIPDTNAAYDIGSAEYKIRDLYLDSGSIHTPSEKNLSFYDGNLTWGGDDVIMLQDLKDMMATATSFEDFKNAIMSL